MADTILYEAVPSREATLHLFDETGLIRSVPLRGRMSVGRNTAQNQCDIPLNLSFVSRRHGEFLQSGERYFYTDLGSTNGTRINGKKCSRDGVSRVELHDGDVLSFGYLEDKNALDRRIVGLFTQTETPFCWQKLSLTEDVAELQIGRGVSEGIAMTDAAVSEKHASFFRSGDGWAVIDHNSTNGVSLNGKRLEYPQYLSPFDVVRIADAYFLFFGGWLIYSAGRRVEESEEESREQPARNKQLCIHIVRRSAFQHFKKLLLLQDIDVTVNDGEMVLILGGSGAGKTTFINAVMGYEKAKGKITYGGADIYEEYERMKYEIGFVPQQDLLRGSDTVYDTLANAAEMKLPRGMSDEKREERIREVLEDLGLTPEKNSLVSKLSGGQRKRLSIAVEYISDPSLFFLDEPDSGLDDIIGEGLMENLRGIADKGKIVMIITHSPERARRFLDKVIVLAKSSEDHSGHLAFFGSVQEAFDFFETDTFRGIIKRINRKDENGEGLADYYIEKYNARSRRR